MLHKCVECGHLLVVMKQNISKGKSYCHDCYRAVKKAETVQKA